MSIDQQSVCAPPQTEATTSTEGEDTAVAALLRCAAREIAAPRRQVRVDGVYSRIVIGGTQVRARFGGGIALELRDRPEVLTEGRWRPLTLDRLIVLVERELPDGNSEFADQVRAGRTALDRLAHADAVATPDRADSAADVWLRSEQSLVAGHPFHPSAKAHLAHDGWRYAPERHATFGLRLFAVPAELALDVGAVGSLDQLGAGSALPAGHVAVPVHPWQADLLGLDGPDRPRSLIDLGTTDAVAIPTSSLRTVYVPALRRCLKLSLHVRITNCVRKNAWYELVGAVELTRRLRPVADDLDRAFPGTRVLAEPGSRSVRLNRHLAEGLGVIVRADPTGVTDPGHTPLLAGALAQPAGPFSAPSLAGADIDGWWNAYLRVVALPVLYAHARHGVAFEAHVQNVLVAVDASGRPRQVILRDLEGTKLVDGRHDVTVLDPQVAASLTYSPEAAWQRVVYCLVVNHLAHVAAALAGADDVVLGRLWREASAVLGEQAWADDAMTALRTVATLPAKANLRVRWARGGDRDAGYVDVPNPLYR